MALGACDTLLKQESIKRQPDLMSLIQFLRDVLDDGIYPGPPEPY